MTTIACDGITVAADSLAVIGDMIVSDEERKLYLADGFVFAITGAMPLRDDLVRAYQFSQDDGNTLHLGSLPKIEAPWTLTVFFENGCFYYTDEVPVKYAMTYPVAFGSGKEYALGAMAAGAGAIAAVEAAATYDVATGGIVRSIDLADLRG